VGRYLLAVRQRDLEQAIVQRFEDNAVRPEAIIVRDVWRSHGGQRSPDEEDLQALQVHGLTATGLNFILPLLGSPGLKGDCSNLLSSNP
jgi:hypothetical protein